MTPAILLKLVESPWPDVWWRSCYYYPRSMSIG